MGRHRAIICSIWILISFGLFGANIFHGEVNISSKVRTVFYLRYADSTDLNYIVIPSGDLGNNYSQEISIILKIEEKNYTLFQKYIDNTIFLQTSYCKRIFDGTGTPWINISLSSIGLIADVEKLSLEVEVNHFRKEGSYSDKHINESKWFQPAKYVDSTHPSIIDKAKEITSAGWSRNKIISKIVTFVKNNVEYNESYIAYNHWIHNETYYGEENGRASDVLRRKQGVCTHFARLFTALSRACNIPTRIVYGYLIEYDETWNIFKPILHAWAEYYDKEMWNFIEPQFGISKVCPAEYVPIINGPMQKDSFYIESIHPNLYILNHKGDDDTHIHEEAYHEDFSSEEIFFFIDEFLGWFFLILMIIGILLLARSK
ncbi:MAG: transglutaminase-like domain-containing protein [Candidatus Hodarchaeales archaeon]